FAEPTPAKPVSAAASASALSHVPRDTIHLRVGTESASSGNMPDVPRPRRKRAIFFRPESALVRVRKLLTRATILRVGGRRETPGADETTSRSLRAIPVAFASRRGAGPRRGGASRRVQAPRARRPAGFRRIPGAPGEWGKEGGRLPRRPVPRPPARAGLRRLIHPADPPPPGGAGPWAEHRRDAPGVGPQAPRRVVDRGGPLRPPGGSGGQGLPGGRRQRLRGRDDARTGPLVRRRHAGPSAEPHVRRLRPRGDRPLRLAVLR